MIAQAEKLDSPFIGEPTVADLRAALAAAANALDRAAHVFSDHPTDETRRDLRRASFRYVDALKAHKKASRQPPDPDFVERVRTAVVALAERLDLFTIDDVWSLLGVELAKDRFAGEVVAEEMSSAAKTGVIARADEKRVSRRHGQPVRVWRSLLRGAS